LPEAEVLPRGLFGKCGSNLSAFEAFELASGVAELSGVGGGGFGLIDRARQTLGVDVLRVGTDDEGATTVGAGSYLTERVYVGVEQGTGSQSGAVRVEVDVTDDITVNTSTGSDASANVGVDWRWDY
jgi:translocation and assembly module TamB